MFQVNGYAAMFPRKEIRILPLRSWLQPDQGSSRQIALITVLIESGQGHPFFSSVNVPAKVHF
jgi:hypothetical protein